jgi:hypothetical protein
VQGAADTAVVPFQLDSVVPWGRRFEEYRAMFALSDEDLERRILGCGDGPASFNAEATALGVDVVSIDPIYRFTEAEIRAQVDLVFEEMIAETARNADEFVWGRAIADLDDLRHKRRLAMELFLADYERGREAGRYLPEQLPQLSWAEGSFDLALCSHLLFLYGEQLSTNFHLEALLELCRVAGEVRVFPLLELGSLPSRHLDEVRASLEAAGVDTSIERVDYEFQRGGGEQLIARARRLA